jgi:hypothetical protein
MLAEISDSQLLAALQVEAALREAEKEQAKGSNDFASHLKRILERGKDKERLDDQKTATAKQRIEERLMAIRTNRGQKGDG